MAFRDVIVIGGSAGSIKALRELMPLLPADLPAAVFVLLHHAGVKTASGSVNFLPRALREATTLSVAEASDRWSATRRGHVYIASPLAHLLVEDGWVRADETLEPSASQAGVDTLFRSAALACGKRVVAVLLSGMAHDGTAGLWDVRRHGGITIVQDPAEAQEPSMPLSAMQALPVHYCLPVPAIAEMLGRLSKEEVAPADQPRVLIVEDERIVALNLEEQLTDLGYRVVGSVVSGEDALRAVERASPDVILMDVQLAGPMKGTEAGELLWRRLGIPIVYTTAYSDERTVRDARASMPYGFIVKPYHAAQIHAVLQLALDRREREGAGGR